MTKKTKNRLAYAWLWIWLLIVTAATVYIYREIFDSTVAVISEFSILLNALEVRGASWITTILIPVGGVFFCWRAVKVLVLHGAPLNLGMQITSGRQDNASAGRMVTLVWIGDEYISENNLGEFWFVVVFSAHPRSDKLMRTRLEVLAAALPFRRSLVISESRISLTERCHLIVRLMKSRNSSKCESKLLLQCSRIKIIVAKNRSVSVQSQKTGFAGKPSVLAINQCHFQKIEC